MTLAIRGLSIAYRVPGGSVQALRDVSLELGRGRTLAVVGESGSGKSTIALALMGLLPPEASIAAGCVRFDDVDLATLSEEQRRQIRGRRIALVFQDPFSVLNPSLRVGEQIGEGLVVHRGLSGTAARARAVDLLREVGIADAEAIASAYPHELSGGMRQRALIAGALATEPDLLVLDEPTTALDVTIEAQILDLLEDLQEKRGLSMLFISHNLGVVRRVADEVAILYAGEVVERGATADVFARPMHPYTKGLLAAIPRLGEKKGALASIPGHLPDLRAPPAGCRFAARCPHAGAGCEARQEISIHEGRTLRCHRAVVVADRPWPAAVADVHAARPAAGRDETPLVAVRDLSKTFELTRGLSALRLEGMRLVRRPVRVRAVDGVTLDIRPGEVVGLVGESGSGKTTLGRAILRLVEADAGSIRIAGAEIRGVPQASLAAMHRQAQIVFQNPDSSLNPRKTVGEILARPLARFAIAPRAEIPARVRRLLDTVRLPAHYADRYPHQMSGGEKQRVGIARALATEPRFIVCDEPVSALDVSVQAAIVNLLAELRDRLGVAYLFVSHDISVVAHLADRIAVMYRGRLVEVGTTAEILAPPSHPYTRALLSAVPSVDGAREARIRLPLEARRGVDAAGCVFAGRCPRRIAGTCDAVAPPVLSPSATHSLACHLGADALGAEGAS